MHHEKSPIIFNRKIDIDTMPIWQYTHPTSSTNKLILINETLATSPNENHRGRIYRRCDKIVWRIKMSGTEMNKFIGICSTTGVADSEMRYKVEDTLGVIILMSNQYTCNTKNL